MRGTHIPVSMTGVGKAGGQVTTATVPVGLCPIHSPVIAAVASQNAPQQQLTTACLPQSSARTNINSSRPTQQGAAVVAVPKPACRRQRHGRTTIETMKDIATKVQWRRRAPLPPRPPPPHPRTASCRLTGEVVGGERGVGVPPPPPLPTIQAVMVCGPPGAIPPPPVLLLPVVALAMLLITTETVQGLVTLLSKVIMKVRFSYYPRSRV